MGNGEWDIDDYLEKLWPHVPEQLTLSFSKASTQKILTADVTTQQLEESYIVMAKVVNTYGERYLPIFERLLEEKENRENKRKLLATALEASKAIPEPQC